MIKTHFDSNSPFDRIQDQGEAPCGAGRGVSQYGISCTSNPARVTCKRCLKKI